MFMTSSFQSNTRSAVNTVNNSIRTPQACENCRRRKIKCNGIKPVCRACEKRKAECAWSSFLAPGNFEVLEMEAIQPQLKRPRRSSNQRALETSKGRDLRRSPTELPEPLLLQRLFDIFLARHHDVELCSFLHKPSLDIPVLCVRSPFLAMAISALSALYVSDKASAEFGFTSCVSMSNHYAQCARFLAQKHFDEPTVYSVQANLVLALRELIAWGGLRAWMHSGNALRGAQALRMDSEYSHGNSPRQFEIRRRTFWACFSIDRLISICCSRPFTLDKTSISIQLPCPETAFVFEEAYKGPTLHDTIELEQRQEIALGQLSVLSVYITAIQIWGDMAMLHMQGGRRRYKYKPTDPAGPFYLTEMAMINLQGQLPTKLRWSPQNYRAHRSIGQAGPFVNLHFVINHTMCVMHQEYLPQLDPPFTDDASLETNHDAAGLSLDYIDMRIITNCMDSANAITKMATFLHSGSDQDKEILQSTFVANALMSAAGVQLWAQYTQTCEKCPRLVSQAKSELLLRVIKSWEGQWKVASAWAETLEMLFNLYSCAYGDGDGSQLAFWEYAGEESQDAVLAEESEAENTLQPGLSQGSRIPGCAATSQRLADKVRNIMLAPLEATEVKKRSLRLYLKTLYQHMWVYDALQGSGDQWDFTDFQYQDVSGIFDPMVGAAVAM